MSLKGQAKLSFANLIVLISYYVFSCPHRLLTQCDTSKETSSLLKPGKGLRSRVSFMHKIQLKMEQA